VFDDHFQTVAPNLALSLPAAINALFDQLWNTSQWQYNGEIPPKYLFDEPLDLPLPEDDADITLPLSLDEQLATACLEELIL